MINSQENGNTTYIDPAVVEHQANEGGANAGIGSDGLHHLRPHRALHLAAGRRSRHRLRLHGEQQA